jgi:Cu+-exporting ATPase
MQERGFMMDHLADTAMRLQAEGRTVSWLASEGAQAVLGLIAFGDRMKPEARQVSIASSRWASEPR